MMAESIQTLQEAVLTAAAARARREEREPSARTGQTAAIQINAMIPSMSIDAATASPPPTNTRSRASAQPPAMAERISQPHRARPGCSAVHSEWVWLVADRNGDLISVPPPRHRPALARPSGTC